MIRAYIGGKGSGKTLSMIIDAVPVLRKGHRVVTNTPIFPQVLHKVFHMKKSNVVFLEGEDFINDFEKSENTLYIIDEGGMVFSKYNWEKFPKQLNYRILTQRKFGNYIFYGTPRLDDVSVQLKHYTEEAVECNKYKLLYSNIYYDPIYFYKDKEDVDIKWQKRYIIKRKFMPMFMAKQYYKIYNTFYVPDPSYMSGFKIEQPTKKADFRLIGDIIKIR